jgi:hypothetical protein
MNAAVNAPVVSDPSAVLDRHATRRAGGVPTVSLLVGPTGAGGRSWRHWAATAGRPVVSANRPCFPVADWVRSAADRMDLPGAAVHALALRAGRDPAEFFAAWQAKAPGDRDRFWDTLAVLMEIYR